jgi:hypothetical protein
VKIQLFDERDQKILATLAYDEKLKPAFDPAKHCLTWADEYAPDLSSAGHEVLYDLWIARGHIHTGKPFHERPLGGDYYEALWTKALNSDIPWNGFRRLVLHAEDQAYLQRMCREFEKPGETL